MKSKNVSYFLSAFFALIALLLLGGLFGGNYLLNKKSQKLHEIKIEKKAIESQEASLNQAKKDVERYREIGKIAKSVVPQDKDQAKTVREITKLAEENNVPIKSVTFANSTLGDAQTAAPQPAQPEGQAPADGQPAATPPPTLSQVKPVKGIAGVYSLEIQIASNGVVGYQNFLNFIEDLEKNRRTAHVNVINVKPDKSGKQLEFQLTLNAYLKP